jgi:hypothetical protein
MIKLVQLQRLLTASNRAKTCRTQLVCRAGERHSTHAIRSQVTDNPLGRTQIVECLQEGWYIETEYSSHKHSDGNDCTGDVQREARVTEEGIEHYTDRLSAGNHAENV